MTGANDPKPSAGTVALVDPPLKAGDRVKLSVLGKSRSPRMTSTGSVVKTGSFKRGYSRVWVLLDGRQTPVQLHSSYIERDQ